MPRENEVADLDLPPPRASLARPACLGRRKVRPSRPPQKDVAGAACIYQNLSRRPENPSTSLLATSLTFPHTHLHSVCFLPIARKFCPSSPAGCACRIPASLARFPAARPPRLKSTMARQVHKRPRAKGEKASDGEGRVGRVRDGRGGRARKERGAKRASLAPCGSLPLDTPFPPYPYTQTLSKVVSTTLKSHGLILPGLLKDNEGNRTFVDVTFTRPLESRALRQLTSNP